MEAIFQHFRSEEKEKIIEIYSKFEIAERDYYPVLLDFLDPRERVIVDNISGHFSDIEVEYFGGGQDEDRERMRAVVHPSLIPISRDDFQITVYRLDYPEKFLDLTHRNILGAIMALGFDRAKLGDIVFGKSIQFAVDSNLKDYINMELTRIKNTPIKLIEIPNDEMITGDIETRNITIIASSYRIDTIVSEVLKESRSKSKTRVEKEKVKINHSIVTNPALNVEIGDIISVRRFGRFIVNELVHETRKGKYRIAIKVYVE
ncbi:RNA-binding protein [Phocicoccus pinnipedialis]|uniref:RNA-binding S4 domain-containing protein n=1 Tax=Phocicoccus pinnipedialis TaxID=110845 RepID=A0A6V7RGE1_9BACL|nr:YlmH/Sll1252 family protein [Jeotgalicoccus pinnipedialis]MBP1939046.1 RNA-binding protein YlmH [Jeotgalicoccus pinnipedialis]CAD2077026.1 hypothetical protein JEOPIN946_01392 [Jeotgalicoccus pinnipedialis]